MSNTPKTDRAYFLLYGQTTQEPIVSAEFARQLERELALKDRDLLLERDRAEKAEKELETERMRLVGCSIAALGYFKGCVDEYKSASLSDVLALKAKYDSAVSDYKELSQCFEKAEAQVKMLVEALALSSHAIKATRFGGVSPKLLESISDKCDEALAKIKKQKT